jgi:hypothetical protein
MDRRDRALVALLLFIVLTGASIAVGGSRPHLEQGIAPAVLQGVGYLFALAGAVLLLAPGGSAKGAADDRRLGLVIAAGVVALVVVDAATMATDSDGADIGAGFLRLVCLAIIGVATARLAVAAAATRSTR